MATHDQQVQLTAGAFAAGIVTFFGGGALSSVFGATPPSSSPVASIASHALWFGGVLFLAVGAITLVSSVPSLRKGVAGYLAIAALGVGVLQGLLWMTWAYVDVLAARHDEYRLFLDIVIAPFGTGLSIMYGILIGGGLAFLAWGLRRTQLTHRFVSWSGVALGCIVVLGAGTVLLRGAKDQLFAILILLYPLLYAWTGIFTVDMYRRQ